MGIRKAKVEIIKCTCEVCGHKWESRQVPLRCASCKSPYWNRTKQSSYAAD